jgi:diacylglycerol kinase (ATP)
MESFSIAKRLKSFDYAFKGMVHAMRTQHNIWIHLLITGLLIFLGFYYNLNSIEWSLILISIGMVLGMEIINSAIEGLTDMVSPEYDHFAGKVKDMAAGGVLFAALTAAIVGVIVFYPHFSSHF